jgi:hypothetical protein
MHGAGKCYKELKKTNTNTPEFSIMDINLNQIYDFKVSPSPKMILKKNPDELLCEQQNGGNITEINDFKNQIINLTERIVKLESKLEYMAGNNKNL